MENLKVSYVRPLAFIKVQTTGLNPSSDRIVELSISKTDSNGKIQTGTRLVNPGITIPDDAIKLHGITNEMVKDKPEFKAIAENINNFLKDCDFVGFNISYFDLKFLSEEFNRAGVEFTILGRKVVDLANIYHAMEPRDLSAAYSFYCNKTIENKSSEQTTKMYFEILNKMMEKYAGNNFIDREGKEHKIEPTVDAINSLFNKNKKQLDLDGFIVLNESNRPVFSKGKYGPKDGKPGQVVSDVLLTDKDYYEWLVEVSNFAPDTKLVIKKIVEKAKAAAIAK